MGARLARALAIDTRALAALRAGLGILLLVDLALRAPELVAHYAEGGAMPAALAARIGGPWRWTLHALSPHPAWPALLLVLAALAAGALALGLRPRVAALASWLLLVSLHHRNHLVLDGADVLLRNLLFWSIWLPLPARGEARPGSHLSLAGVGLLLQPVLVYVFTALIKTGPEWWEDASAVRLALDYGQLARFPPAATAALADLSGVLTPAVLAVELGAPVLLLLPWPTPRLVGILLLLGLQAGLFAFLAIPLFAPVATLALVPFLPAPVWDGLAGGKSGSPAPGPPPAPVRAAHPADPALALLLGWVVVANLTGLPAVAVDPGARFQVPGQVLGLEQVWHMFAPGPPDKDGYYVFRGRVRGGPWFDLATGAPPVPPASHRYAGLPSYRWWKRLEPLQLEPWMAEPALRGRVREARAGGRVVEEAELVFMAFNLRVPRARRQAVARVLVRIE